MAVILFIYLIKLYGNWQDSTPMEETKVFFQEIAPSFLPQLTTSAFFSKSNATVSEILSIVPSYIPKEIIGLLNLSLNLKYFNPQVSSQKNFFIEKSPLKGWFSISNSKVNVSKDSIQKKVLSYINTLSSPYQKIDNLREAVIDINKYYSKIIHEHHYSLFDFQNSSPLSLINGHLLQQEETPHSILEAFLQEEKLLRSLYLLHFNENQTNAIQYHNPQDPVYYTDIFPKMPETVAHDWEKMNQTLSPSVDVNNHDL